MSAMVRALRSSFSAASLISWYSSSCFFISFSSSAVFSACVWSVNKVHGRESIGIPLSGTCVQISSYFQLHPHTCAALHLCLLLQHASEISLTRIVLFLVIVREFHLEVSLSPPTLEMKAVIDCEH